MAKELSDAADLLADLEALARQTRAARPAAADAGTDEPAPRLKPGGPPSPTSAEEHRSRLRNRLLTGGPDAVADHELLEMILFLAILRRDTKPIAYRLIQRFGSFANAIAAPMRELLAVQGIGESGAAALKIVHAASVRLARAEVVGQPVLSNWDVLMDYLNAVMARERVEQFRIRFCPPFTQATFVDDRLLFP